MNYKAIEQAMNDRQRIASRIYDEFIAKQGQVEFEDMLTEPCYEEIRQLAKRNATEIEFENAAYGMLCAAKEAGFIFGYTYAIERLRKTLLLQ